MNVKIEAQNLGLIELETIGRTLIKLSDRLYPEGFETKDLEVFIEDCSQNGAVRNAYDQIIIEDGEQLNWFYILPSGHCGTLEDLKFDQKNNCLNEEDAEYLKEL